MATRIALVLVAGQMQQLQAGDTLGITADDLDNVTVADATVAANKSRLYAGQLEIGAGFNFAIGAGSVVEIT